MKFKSALVTQVSGSVGGMTGSHNAGGLYFRARAVPVNPNTVQQQAVRNFMSQCAAAWSQTLTQEQRDAWSNYAASVPITDTLGEARFISGISHFVRSNVARLQAGLARIDAGPAVYVLPDFTAPSFAADASDDNVAITFTNGDAWAGEVGGAMLVFASRPQPASIVYFKGPYRYAGKISGAVSPPASPATLDLPFPVVENDRVFFQVRVCRADGRLSSPFRGFDDAAA